MGRAPCCDKVGVKRGPWTPDEDEKLVSYIKDNGHGSWRSLPKKAGLLRCGKSCRLRWTNYLRPDIKRGEFSASEEQTILQLHALLGSRWSAIASHLPKRTDNEIKNYWNTHMKKKLLKMGIDPTTHKPKVDSSLIQSHNTTTAMDTTILLQSSKPISGSSATSHMAQWESARLEAEARLAHESKMRAKGLWPASPAVCAGRVPSSFVSSPAVPAILTNLGLQSFNNIVNNGAASLGALNAFSAVELMHALQNWEKSLQGQAGFLWPDSWRLLHENSASMREGQADESSSCSSPPTYKHTKGTAVAAPSPHRMDHCSPTSTLSSLDSRNAKKSSATISCDCVAKKLFWSDDLVTPKPLEASKPQTEFSTKEEIKEPFSGLMLDAVFDASTMESPYVTTSKGVNKKEVLSEEGTCEKTAASNEKDVEAGQAMCIANQDVDATSNTSMTSGGVFGELELEEENDTCMEDDEDEKSICVNDGETMSSEMFKDLPKLKQEATTTQMSYTALLSEEISDYWSSLVLKEQVNSPTIHYYT